MTNKNPRKSIGAKLAKGPDDLKANAVSPDGKKTPIAVKSGEFVFSIPAIIGLGKGDYNKGLEALQALHRRLKEIGEKYLSAEEHRNG